MNRFLLVGLLSLLTPWGVQAGEPKVVQLSPDTYMVVVKNHAGIFGNPQTTKVKAIEAANAFAEKQGKIAIPLGLESTPAGGPGHWPAVEYQFRVVAPNDPEAGRTALVPRADVSIDVKTSPPSAAPATSAPAKADLYTELLKLDDLRKRGLITDAEFEEQKRRLLVQ